MAVGLKGTYLDHTLPIEKRAEDLLSKMTLDEKISQMSSASKEIKRLNIKSYGWWNEGLHGVAGPKSRIATVFPQAIGLAATWNTDMLYKVASATSDEARAKYNQKETIPEMTCLFKIRKMVRGLTYWSPVINIARDPRWGRIQETYGEDPYLTSRLAVSFIKGLQGDDPEYMKIAACAKHFGVHSGPEKTRIKFNAKVSEKDFRETYLPAFEACIKEAGVGAVMTAYSAVNGVPCTANTHLIEDILRKEFGFKGYTVSDCSAVTTLYFSHKFAKSFSKASAMALNSGCNLECGINHPIFLKRAVKQNLVTEKTIDKNLKQLLLTKFKLGMFDNPKRVPYSSLTQEIVDCEKHRALALESARESIVLLKNKNSILPLKKEKLKSVSVIGPNADDESILLGNYNGYSSNHVTILEGIKRKLKGINIMYEKGCKINSEISRGIARAVESAKKSDIVFLVLGLSQKIEAEGKDRENLGLPVVQERLMKEVYSTGKPMVIILLNGSAVAVNWAEEHADAIVEAWYPGEEGGNAVADIIFGDYNPSGRLPLTFYKSLEHMPLYEDYSMENRTYKFMKYAPLYPFGYGLSYTKFKYYSLKLKPAKIKTNEDLEISVYVENEGNIEGDEVVQVYIKDIESSTRVPSVSLAGFQRVHLKPKEVKKVEFRIKPSQLSVVDEKGKRFVEPGEFIVYAGGMQPDTNKSSGFEILEKKFEVVKKIDFIPNQFLYT